MAMENCQHSAMVSLLIVSDLSSPAERIAAVAAVAAATAAEEVEMGNDECKSEEGRVSRTENVPGVDSRRTSLEIQKVRALRTRDSDMWSCLTSWSSVFVTGLFVRRLPSLLLGCVWKA